MSQINNPSGQSVTIPVKYSREIFIIHCPTMSSSHKWGEGTFNLCGSDYAGSVNFLETNKCLSSGKTRHHWNTLLILQSSVGQILNNGRGELPGGGVTSQVLGLHLAIPQHLRHCIPDPVPVLVQTGMLQHVGRREQHGGGVGNILACPLAE
jgi:hypothetical protein